MDFSNPIVAIAQKKNRKHIKSGRVKVQLGDFDKVEFRPNSFS